MRRPAPGNRHSLLAAVLVAALMVGCALPGPTTQDAGPSPVEAAASTPAPASAAAAASAPDRAASAVRVAEAEAAVEAPVDPVRPEVAVDLNDRAAQDDLWQRVRNGFGIADLDDDFVRKREYFYARQPEYVQRMAERGTGRGQHVATVVAEVVLRQLEVTSGGGHELPHA